MTDKDSILHNAVDSIEHPGFKLYATSMPEFAEPAAYVRFLKYRFEQAGLQVDKVLSYYNDGKDFYTGKKVKESDYGFEVIFKC